MLVISSDWMYIKGYLEDVKQIADDLLKNQMGQIEKIIDILFIAWLQHRWVYVMGNGGSASTATHFAADLFKTVINGPNESGIKAVALVDNIPLVSAIVNDWGWNRVFDGQLATFWEPGGVAVGISVHGGAGKDKAGAWSQNILSGLRYAKTHGGKVIGLAGFDGGPMKDYADACVVVPANSTPLVESFHVVLHHLIVFRLKERIEEYKTERGEL